MQRHLLFVLLIAFVSCTAPSTTNQSAASTNAADFEKLTDDLLYGALALSPVTATQVGYHEHNGVQLDEQLDDFSTAGIETQRRFYEGLTARINSLDAGSLDKEQRADLDIMKTRSRSANSTSGR
jgi:uncharacterized protein (DUF885 family)